MTTRSVSVTEFKAHCLDVIRRVERDGTAIDLTRRGKVVARLVPTVTATQRTPPWLRLRGQGRLDAAAEEGVLERGSFAAEREPGA
jgi:prevent-host-death family protein